MAAYLLAHDLGTSGDKAVLYSADGTLVKSTVYAYELLVSHGNWAEQRAGDWWQAVCATTRELTAQIDPAQIAAVSFSGQMLGCLCVDGAGEPLRPALIWADMRAARQEQAVRQRIAEERFYRITGHRISASYSAFKLMWLQEHEPDTYRRTYKMLNAKDYILLRLTGRFVTDYSDASSTCLLDLDRRVWSEELLGLCGLDAAKMPELLPSTAVVGPVTQEAARETGLLAGTPVVCGGGDGVCAAVGTGVVREGIANGCLGTSSWISMASKAPVYDAAMTTFNFAHIVPGYTMPCGTMQCGGGSLSWAVRELCRAEAAEAQRGGPPLYEAVERAVAASPAGARGLTFLPYLIGERSPRWNDRAKGAFVGLTLEHTRDDMLRAVMEGVAYNLDIILRAFLKSGCSIEELILIGGGARSAVWRQILADVFGRPIVQPQALEEATSIGAAVTAGVGVGVFPDFQITGRFLQAAGRYVPDPGRAAEYAARKPVFEACYRGLEPVFDM